MFQVSVSQFVCHLFSLIRDDLPDMRKKYLKNLIHICNIKTITFGIGISFTDLISLTSRPSVQMKPVCLPKIVTQLYTAIYCYGKYPYIIIDKIYKSYQSCNCYLMQFIVETTGIADRLAFIISSPQGGGRSSTVSTTEAHSLWS